MTERLPSEFEIAAAERWLEGNMDDMLALAKDPSVDMLAALRARAFNPAAVAVAINRRYSLWETDTEAMLLLGLEKPRTGRLAIVATRLRRALVALRGDPTDD